jgi:predicted branched-subunit amino acid permease
MHEENLIPYLPSKAVELSTHERLGHGAVVMTRGSLDRNRSIFFRGIRDALALPAWVVGLSVLGIGGLARDVGHPAGAALLSTLLMWAGPAQVILYGGLAAGAALPGIALAVCLSSIRLLPMTMSVLPLLRRPGHSIAVQLLAAHYVAVTVWVESLRRLPSMPVEQRFPYFLGFANATLGVSSLLTFLGYYLAGALPTPFAAGLLFLTPVFFTISLSAGARSLVDWSAIGLGFLVTPLFTMAVGRDFDLLAAGVFGGTAAYVIGRIRQTSSA